MVREPEAEIISGGTDVLIRIREGKDAGRALVSIHNIKELKGVKVLENGDLWIGSATAFSHITNDPTIQKLVPMLGEAVDMVGGPQIRNTGTIGGNICNGATSADSAASMWTLNALIQLEGPEGHREVPIHEFYTGPGRTVRDRCEVCTGFIIKKEDYEGWYGQYIKYGKRKAMEIATLGCAVRVKLSSDKKTIEDVRLGYGVAGPTPLRCHAAEEYLRGKDVSDKEAAAEFAKLALTEVNPRSSWRASKEFRLQLIEELAKRGLQKPSEEQEVERMLKIIHMTVNGKETEIAVDERESLLDTLRNRLGITSVKKGCEVGECGACTVLVNGEAIDSCIYLTMWADGKSVMTVEGLKGPNGELSPIQRAFIEEAAVQCGFCTPGLIMSAVEDCRNREKI